MPIKKSEKTASPANIKKELEAFTGHKIDFSAEQLIKVLRYPIGAYDYTDGSAAWRSIIIFPGKSCSDATLLDVSGVSFTEADGTRAFLLSDFVCLPQLRSLAEPINVLATARSTTPFFVTTAHALVNNGTDVQITIFAWDAKGAPAPNVTFDWRCRVVSNQIIV
ncbi:MAG: hypothetical protein DME50_17315 [Verrucomicrobia bacterium]|nr:MAG: hypothetical protein DME85_14355 [Verrucomicrobiota bacterium]PYK63558.1 MAG: hypothetical protein DME50_17315 [Verrucomicrobiota bacterium]